MLDAKTALGIASIVTSSAIGIVGLVIESRKTTKLSNEDIDLVADKTANKVIEKLGVLQTSDED